MKTRNVRVWDIKVNQRAGKKRSYTVRWVVAGRERSQTFTTRALADNHRSDLMQAVNRGEAFDRESGLPESMIEVNDSPTWLAFAIRYVEMKWAGAAAKSRTSMIEALASVTPVLMGPLPARPNDDVLRAALRDYVLPPNRISADIPRDVEAAVRWLERSSLRLVDLAEASVIRTAIDALGVRLDGKPAAATTMRRKRAVFYNALEYAVELEELAFNPIDKLKVHTRRSKVVVTVDRRVVVNPTQARELLTAVSYVGSRGNRGPRLVAFFACMYFGALRPAEVLGLREQDCHLPEAGWGRLTLAKSRPSAGKRWTNSGEAHDERGLKHRGEDEPRSVPIPPELVAMLRAHLAGYGTAKDGRLFHSRSGKVVGASSYSRVWDEARRLALRPAQVDSPLAGRPYDLRHACVSFWLNAGVPAAEVAERAGHSVDVLLKVYAKCIDGQEAAVNSRIEDALGGGGS